ncbi:MAG: folate/biopterin family MFS transporter [Thermosynechococcaceae cyanobacterium MS004]|nr:folate/biopterin family MFS transporter [Thermosynechococcaceae cyanobacterium MS004]
MILSNPLKNPAKVPDPLERSASSPLSRWFRSKFKSTLLFGQEPSWQLFAILLVYFVQGILGLARLAVSFFLKDELGLTPAEVAALMGVVALPWVIKPLFGFLSDSLPLFGYRRRSYLLLSSVLGSAAWFSLGSFVHSAGAATLVITLSSLAIAVSDVIVDSIVVERIRAENQADAGALQSLCWATTALGGLITAYLSGFLLEHLDLRTIFLITASFPLLVSIAAVLLNDSKVEMPADLSAAKMHLQKIKAALTQKQIWLPVFFVFLWQATPSSDSAFFFFSTNELGFQPEFLGRVRLVTSIATLLGVWVFQRFLKTIPLRSIFLWSTLISMVLGMTTLILVTHANRSLGIDDQWFSLGDSLVQTVMGQIAFMPVLVLAAQLCPAGIEATMFAILMSVSNLAGLLSHESGALLTHWLGVTETNFEWLWLLVTVTNLTTLLPLPLLNWVPESTAALEESPVFVDAPEAVLTPELAVAELVD